MTITKLAGSRILMILAHCDDEIICGWPILQDPTIKKTILMVSSDRYSKDRKWCAHRKFVFMDVCMELSIKFKVLDYDSHFSALPSRDGSLLKLERSIAQIIGDGSDYDYVFTHNPFGEYGHHDHKYLFNKTVQLATIPVLISDICMQSDWTDSNSLTQRMRLIYYSIPILEAKLESKFYDRMKMKYDLAKVWTWNQQPITDCKLYIL
jgi:LmbE family N-acetylglucosaminyl deacetylase